MRSQNQYRIPFLENTLTVAISDPFVHYAHFAHAIDFLLTSEVNILAAKSGTVQDVKDDSNQGGLEKKFQEVRFQNYITIEHENSEFSQYVHLANNSSLVAVGDKVDEGTLIAKGIGKIGYTSRLHLHMMVFKLVQNEPGFESLEITWKSPIKVYKTRKNILEELQKEKYQHLLNSTQIT
jgi:murein DD-endopeptidase MepM/ murein hydrolase activator NlpD